MKRVLPILMTLSFSTLAFADVQCKKSSEAIGQGFEVSLSDSSKVATLIFKGIEVATLQKLPSGKKSRVGADQISATHYSENAVNGFSLIVRSGGITGRTSVEVLRGGVAGNTTQAALDDCRYSK